MNASTSPKSLATKRRFWAPGRVNLIGEHTDYSGGLVCPAAIDLGITISAERSELITLSSALEQETIVLSADGSTATPLRGWGRYVAAVAKELDLLGRLPIGITGAVESTIPAGAGLSSSAALEVAIALALCAVADFELTALEIASACCRAEVRAVGVPCGIMDQAASAMAVEGCALLLDCSTLECEALPLPDDLSLVIVDSGIKHRLEFSGYADRRDELDDALARLDGARPAELTIGGAERLAESAGLDDLHRRRLRHVVTENGRVREVAAILRSPDGDRARLGELFLEGHLSLRNDYEVTTPELDRLVSLAYEHGATAARMTGGGFGGSILALVPQETAQAFAVSMTEAHGRTTDAVPGVQICVASGPARELLER